MLISGDAKGNIFKWNYNSNSHCRYFAENKPITQMKTCRNKQIAAVGYKHGCIVILNVQSDQMKILFKLKHHEDAINCLYWFPVLHNDNEESHFSFDGINEQSLVLCSSSDDKTIRLWSVETGTQIRFINSPSLSGSSRSQKQVKVNFTPLCWPNQRYIISASYK